MQTIFEKESRILAQKAGLKITSLISAKKNLPVLLLVSGGSAFQILDTIDSSILGKRITIGVLDERYSLDPEINNFLHFTKTKFYTHAKKNGCSFIDTHVHNGETLEAVANRFDNELKKWKTINPKGIILITQGVGPDGHTAGIFPGIIFENTNKWVIGYDIGKRNQYPLRITTTPYFLTDMVDYSIVFVTGENKKKVLQKVLDPESIAIEVPAAIIQKMKNVEVFTDIRVT